MVVNIQSQQVQGNKRPRIKICDLSVVGNSVTRLGTFVATYETRFIV